MVGELEIEPAAVNVELLPQVFGRHDRAFDVPARPPVAPRARPGRFVGLGEFPEREIERAFLPFMHVDPRAGFLVLFLLAGQFAVILVLIDFKIDTVFQYIGEAFINQAADPLDHFLNVVGRFGIDIRPFDVKFIHRLQV